MENNRYYTPTIDEFHIGFEYEMRLTANDLYENNIWMKVTCSWSDLDIVCDDFEHEFENIHNLYRVKYLDREDIESLGFVNLPDTNSFDYGDFQIYFQDYTYIEIYDDCGRLVFQGTIKNKSELKRVLKQVGVL